MFSYFRGVCISDLIPFYLGKLFRKSRASDDILSKVSPTPTFLLLFLIHSEELGQKPYMSSTYILSVSSHEAHICVF